jgi:hypothetical protein
MKYLAIALALAALTGAQTPGISIRPGTTGPVSSIKAGSRMGAPILGYLAGPGALELHVILGTAKGAQLGGALPVPAGAKRLFVPPREHYLFVESKGSEPLGLWMPTKPDSEILRVSGAMAHPDSVVFSARGDAAVLYGKSSDSLQIVSGLPAEPVLTVRPGIAQFGEPANFAVSDDGVVVVVVTSADGTAIASAQASSWQRLPAAYGASALGFVPRTHNLIVSDSAQQTITLVSNVAENTQATQMLAHGVAADKLAFTKEGFLLLAASSAQNKLWTIDLKTMLPGPVSSASSIETLLPLRDGHTFLYSLSAFSLINLPVDSDSAAAAGDAHVTR